MKVRILVSLKESILDPQGQTVKNALHTLGYRKVRDVREGKVFELDLPGVTEEEAKTLIPVISDRVLANPIIEEFSWQILKES
jgi:phosphoribosylformylglycinamidine synthase PurS subunit